MGIVSRLEQKGLVERCQDGSDRRVKWVRLTPRGREFYTDTKRQFFEAEREMLSALTEEEREIFDILLQKIYLHIQ